MDTSWATRLRRLAVAAAMLTASLLAAVQPVRGAEDGVGFNQTYLESVLSPRAFDIEDTMGVFAHVFAALPDEVTVYPTENYYYFTFGYNGLQYSGNIRLDVQDRDEGVLHFAYFNTSEDWNTDLMTRYRPLGATDGVTVEKQGPLRYQVSYRGKQVLFALNDLGDVVPPQAAVRTGETYLGPVFDESGYQFYLLFNAEEKYFLFVLNEQGAAADRFVPYDPDNEAILLGMRAGFALYRDPFRDRKILIGVYAGNVDTNNYFDGPFDQLPDNFMPAGELQKAILTLYPDLKGKIDGYGVFVGGNGRFLVNPYVNYLFLTEFDRYFDCSPKARPAATGAADGKAASGQPAPDPRDEAAFYRCVQPAEDR